MMKTIGDNRAIGIAGAGRVGQALGRLLVECGEPVIAIAGRDTIAELPGRAARILIAVPDDALSGVAETLAGAGMSDGIALHTCGTRGPEALAALSARGVSCGVLHPLQTVASPSQGAAALKGASFGVCGDREAVAWARRIVELVEGEVLEIQPESQPLYHAAAVMASNYVVGLIDAAALLMGEAGIGRAQALRALAPLVRASVENALTMGPEAALTGPIERGDVETVSAHLRALSSVPEPIRELYRHAGLHVAGLACRKLRNHE